MLRIVPFEASHLDGVTLHPKQARYQYLLDRVALLGACTALEDGGVVAIGGVVETQDGMAGWLLFTDKMQPRHFLPIYRACRRGMAALRQDGMMVVADVAADYPEAARLAALLGFASLRQVVINGQSLTRMAVHGA